MEPLATTVLASCGIALMSLVFLGNAVGLIDPSRAARELADTGWIGMEHHADAFVVAGRSIQLANFLKNAAMIGGLLVIASWSAA